LLPLDPDASARTLRQAIADRAGIRVAVVISDTSGRTWRRGVTDNAIGVAGMAAVADLRGLPDTSGVPLEVTEIAVADEVAAAADLVKGKLSGIPAAVLRGLLPLADDGQGSASLRRPVAEDMFALGTRDVVRTRRSPTGFARQPVSIPVLRAAIEAAHRATDIDDCLRLVADLVPAQAWPEIEETATTQAGRLLGQASGVIVPMIPDQDDAESLTRLGMAIGALLIQLHAEGLAASWLSPAELDTLDLDTPIADRLPGPLARGARTHGLVVMGQPDLQIER
jgi:coenzyme F420-0:L-glutamate ligase/coenzyme F420-1:gamma-L-glutamate ligase